ncbi:uncharacterized protein BCN122_I2810 [Burkholderia cenocepacia]|nr:uncharacterized protein BCN122_I2810 [Burkholderia cenocepacia]
MVKSAILAIGFAKFFQLAALLRETLDPADFPLSLHCDATR